MKARRTLTQTSVKKDGRRVMVPVEVHQSDEVTASCSDVDEEPESDSSDGRTLWYLSEGTSKGTPVTRQFVISRNGAT